MSQPLLSPLSATYLVLVRGRALASFLMLLGALDASAWASRGERARLVHRAERYVGIPNLARISPRARDDCSGLVRLVYGAEGIALGAGIGRPSDNDVTHIFREARRVGAIKYASPRPGDLVFFRETYDRNRNGLMDDGLTHIGLVESVRGDGTVAFIHRGGGGVARSHFNLNHPRRRLASSGKVLNDYLRRKANGSRALLAGELVAGMADLEKLRRASSRNRP